MTLRAVGTDEKPPTFDSVFEAYERGTERDVMVAELRVVLRRIDDPKTANRDMAALTKRRRDLMEDIKALDARDHQEAERRGPTDDEAWTAV